MATGVTHEAGGPEWPCGSRPVRVNTSPTELLLLRLLPVCGASAPRTASAGVLHTMSMGTRRSPLYPLSQYAAPLRASTPSGSTARSGEHMGGEKVGVTTVGLWSSRPSPPDRQ